MTRLDLLLVDDDPAVHAMLGPVLGLENVTVHSARTQREAERLLDSRRFDLVVVDLALRGRGSRDGLETISAARRLAPRTPVVLFSACVGAADAREARARGALDVWSKSLAIEDLVSRVKRAAGSPPIEERA